jgi:hypothetical protein
MFDSKPCWKLQHTHNTECLICPREAYLPLRFTLHRPTLRRTCAGREPEVWTDQEDREAGDIAYSVFALFARDLGFYPQQCKLKKKKTKKRKDRIHMYIYVYIYIYIFFFFFVALGLEYRAYTLSHSISPFCVRYFWDRVSWTICPGWLWTAILLISAWVARIIGVSHWHPATIWYYIHFGSGDPQIPWDVFLY